MRFPQDLASRPPSEHGSATVFTQHSGGPAMITRKRFLGTTAANTRTLLTLEGCSSGAVTEDHETATRRIWRHAESPFRDPPRLRRELVRYATLAPSSHNTQPWRFHIAEHAITILPDLSRRCPVVDPDNHHLFVSLGCATENLIQAALANGLEGEPQFDVATGALRVALEPTLAVASSMFQAIPDRQCTRTEFDGRPLSTQELGWLEQAGTGAGVRVLLQVEPAAREQTLEAILAANSAQLGDARFVEELKTWIRFERKEAVQKGDGLFSGCTGNPSVPRWLGSALFGLLVTAKGENDKIAKQVRSSAGFAVFVSEANDPVHWLEVGRCFERFTLLATAMGIRTSLLNQPVEVAALRRPFATHLGLGQERPDLVVRFGRGPRMPSSLRRPLQDVLA